MHFRAIAKRDDAYFEGRLLKSKAVVTQRLRAENAGILFEPSPRLQSNRQERCGISGEARHHENCRKAQTQQRP